MPTYETPPLPEGQFLNSAFTSKFKALQIAEISDLIERGVITDGDTLFFSDIWFPGIESIAYMKYFNKMDNLKITGIIHAGSFTDTDFVRDMERWAKNFEDIIFDISDTIYCASNFIKNDIIKKRMIDPNKLVVSGLPVDYTGLEKHKGQTKKDIVIFNGRLCDEKQPWLFNELRDQVSKRLDRDVQFLKTQEMNLSKEEYYSLLGKSKAVVSYALQENFGFGVAEAVYLGCTPVLPNRLVYPELYPDTKLFNRFDESVDMVINALNDYQEQQIVLDTDQVMQTWFGVKDNTGDKI
jgi:glycosyltransferase involved in cell wall biosynthesis